jgi:hypothetical protein
LGIGRIPGQRRGSTINPKIQPKEICSMIGEMLGETHGKRILRRVISSTPLKVEVTFEDAGKMLGVDMNGFGTYTSEVRGDGSIYGTGSGIYTSAAGDMLAWEGSGLGKFGDAGAVSYRGILYYRTTSPKLAKLNTVCGVFEYEVDAKGNTVAKIWEWK